MTLQYGAVPEPVVVLTVERGLRRRRLSSFFRLLLSIPHLLVLFVLNIAAAVVLVIAWFSALVLGRLPAWQQTFLAGYVGWNARVYGYVFLLTDRYPPFTFEDPTYPVRVEIPPGGPLNRFAVFFRLVLMIPALVVNSLLSGAQLFVVFAWFAAIFAGRTPRAVHDAIATFVRYGTRVAAYAFLLTPTYPWGPLGDGVERGVPAWATAPPGYGPSPGYGTPPGYGPPPGDGAPTAVEAPAVPPPSEAGGYPPSPGAPAYPPGFGAPAYPPGFGAPAYPPGLGGPAYPPGFGAAGYPPMPPVGPEEGGEPAAPPYDGRVSSGARAILIVSLVLGAANVGGRFAGGFGGGSGFQVPHIGEAISVTRAQADFDDATDATTTVAICAPQQDCNASVGQALSAAAAEYSRRLAGVDDERSRRDALLASLATYRTDVGCAAAAGSLTDNIGNITDQTVTADRARIDRQSTSLIHALN